MVLVVAGPGSGFTASNVEESVPCQGGTGRWLGAAHALSHEREPGAAVQLSRKAVAKAPRGRRRLVGVAGRGWSLGKGAGR